MKCTLCGEEIVLIPSAQERAHKAKLCGQGAPYDSPSYYTNLFTTHTSCALEKSKQDTAELLRRKQP